MKPGNGVRDRVSETALYLGLDGSTNKKLQFCCGSIDSVAKGILVNQPAVEVARVAPNERSDDKSNDRYGVSVSRLEKDAW